MPEIRRRVVAAASALAAMLVAPPIGPGAGSAHPAKTCVRLPAGATALRARPDNLARENTAARRQNLSWLRNLDMVRQFRRSGLLVPVPAETNTYWVADVSPPLRVTRPWTKRFVEHLSQAFHGRFSRRLKITSLTRTAATQHALRATNGNAAPARGRLRSTHLTGASVDISKQPLDDLHVRWLRAVLGRLAGLRLLSAIEEFAQPHFHVLVFRDYAAVRRGRLRKVLGPPC